MTARQTTGRKWSLTLPAVLFAMMIAFTLMNGQIIPMIHNSTQTSRLTAWESGVPSPSYAQALKKAQVLNAERVRGVDHTSFLKSTSGEGWEMWDRSSVLYDNMNLTCNWNEYRPFVPRGKQAPSAQFCAHPLSDDQFVSNNIVKKGRHLECDGLPKLLSSSLNTNGKPHDGQPVIYVDIGANIGTCVMQMLLTTNATILAFEPHPFNLHALTATFMELEPKDRNRIHLFPIALGAESGESTIHMASDNRGHAVVSKVIRINRKATFLPPMPIRVEPLDAIIQNGVDVHLMKMDAQGFECYIFDGMKRVLHRTKTVFFELERQVLNGFDRCSPKVLWDNFIRAGFQMHIGGTGRKATTELPDKGKINIVALNQ